MLSFWAHEPRSAPKKTTKCLPHWPTQYEWNANDSNDWLVVQIPRRRRARLVERKKLLFTPISTSDLRLPRDVVGLNLIWTNLFSQTSCLSFSSVTLIPFSRCCLNLSRLSGSDSRTFCYYYNYCTLEYQHCRNQIHISWKVLFNAFVNRKLIFTNNLYVSSLVFKTSANLFHARWRAPGSSLMQLSLIISVFIFARFLRMLSSTYKPGPESESLRGLCPASFNMIIVDTLYNTGELTLQGAEEGVLTFVT